MGAKRLHIFVFLLFVLQGCVNGLQCFDTSSSGEIVPRDCMESGIGRNVDTVLDKGQFFWERKEEKKLCAENRCNSENNFPEKVAVKELQCYVSTNYGKIVLDTCPVNAIGCEVQIRKTEDGTRIYSQLRGCSFGTEVGSDKETCFETGCNSLEKYPVGSPSKVVSPATTASQTVPSVKTLNAQSAPVEEATTGQPIPGVLTTTKQPAPVKKTTTAELAPIEEATTGDVDIVLNKDAKRLCDHFHGCAFPDSENDETKPKDAKPPVLCAKNTNIHIWLPDKIVLKKLMVLLFLIPSTNCRTRFMLLNVVFQVNFAVVEASRDKSTEDEIEEHYYGVDEHSSMHLGTENPPESNPTEVPPKPTPDGITANDSPNGKGTPTSDVMTTEGSANGEGTPTPDAIITEGSANGKGSPTSDAIITEGSPNGESKPTPAPINSTPDHDQPKEGSGIPSANGAKMPAICHSLVIIAVIMVTTVSMQTIFHFKQPG